MRRPTGAYWALSSASSAAQTVPLSHSSYQSTSSSLRLLQLLAVVSVIGSQFHDVLSAAAAATTSNQQHSSGAVENHSFFFDDYNTTKTTSSTAAGYPSTGASASTAALAYQDQSQSQSQSQSQFQAQMPSAAAAAVDLSHFAINPGMRLDRASVKAAGSNEISNSTPIKNLITSFGRPALMADDQQKQQREQREQREQLLPGAAVAAAAVATTTTTTATTTLAATLKSAKSTIKQPIDSTRSRNHWTVGSGARGTERPRTFRSKHHHEHHWGPFFEEPVNSGASGENLVAAVHLFTEAVLNCRVGMLKDKTVMWVRRTSEKVSLLTVGNVTYSGDPRIRVKFQYPNNWRLLINPTQTEDAGIYMCQVSTHPPRVFTTNLTILEPPLRIIDEHERDVGDRYYKSGSTVDLQCQISRNFFLKERYTILKSTETTKGAAVVQKLYNESSGDASQDQLKLSGPELEKYFSKFITWTKDEEPLQGLTNKRSSISDKWLTSRISIDDAKLSDSGNYSCSLGRLFTVIVQVQVLTG
ncbi:hypothetical protein KR032_002973, partial [Drosophila birchii]